MSSGVWSPRLSEARAPTSRLYWAVPASPSTSVSFSAVSVIALLACNQCAGPGTKCATEDLAARACGQRPIAGSCYCHTRTGHLEVHRREGSGKVDLSNVGAIFDQQFTLRIECEIQRADEAGCGRASGSLPKVFAPGVGKYLAVLCYLTDAIVPAIGNEDIPCRVAHGSATPPILGVDRRP